MAEQRRKVEGRWSGNNRLEVTSCSNQGLRREGDEERAWLLVASTTCLCNITS
jgi:hypothetical protein